MVDEIIAKQEIIYIYGSGRSGTTLLATLLGLQKGILSAGELNRGFVDFDRTCSCGEKIRQCQFWNPVIENMKKESGVAPGSFFEVFSSLESKKNFISWMLGKKDQEFTTYKKLNKSLFSHVAGTGREERIVDASKNVMRFSLLKKIYNNVILMHSVRNPRAVLYSNMKKYHRKKLGESSGLLRFRILYYLYVLISWNITNLLALLIKKGSGVRYIRVRYEALSTQPMPLVNSIVRELCGSEFSPHHREMHNIYGNRMLHDFTLEDIKIDEEWKGRIKWYHNIAVHLLTFPSIWIYGYGKSR